MAPRRSKLEIQLEVLKAVKRGVAKPTRIMYSTNMSYVPITKTLDDLVSRGLLSVINSTTGNTSKKRYEITEKGTSVLHYFEGVKELVDII